MKANEAAAEVAAAVPAKTEEAVEAVVAVPAKTEEETRHIDIYSLD